MTVERQIRVAVACSGLGHIQRGIEAWASDLARGLDRAGLDVTLFGGAAGDRVVPLACLKRTSFGNRVLAGMFRSLGGWRYGAGSPYEVEQTSFSVSLWRKIHRDFDILHVQDPMIARWFEMAHIRGLSRPQVIYANGTGENDSVMRRFRNLQLLTQETHDAWTSRRPSCQSVFMIPNFVDTSVFAPGDQSRARARFGLPADRTIFLCCAAIRRYHKRIDKLLEEFSTLADPNAMLVIAGGREADTDKLIAMGTGLLGDRVRFLPGLPREDMPDLYRAADLFVLSSLHEMFGIVLIEAMASGLPVLCHDAPHFRAIVGPSGAFRDIAIAGGLAAGMRAMLEPSTRAPLARAARAHMRENFSEAAVIPRISAMYRTVIESSDCGDKKPPAVDPVVVRG